MKRAILLATAAIAAMAVSAQAAIVVETTNFIASPTAFNGFEGIGADPNTSGIFFPANTTYSEGGISVSYVGSAQMWLTYQRVGDYGWYENGGGTGYTKVTLTSGADFQALEFLAGTGFGSSTTFYRALLNGNVVSTGTIGPVTGGFGNSGLSYYGLSGGGFDEVHLQSHQSGAFDPNSYEAGAYDNFAALSAGVPEPASWAMMILGFGMAGAAARRRSKVSVTYA